MSPQLRQTIWCVAILILGAAFVGFAIFVGASVEWDLMNPAPGRHRSSPAIVVPSLFILGFGAIVASLFVIRLPADRYVSSPDDDESA
ncbi:hypothetical protein EYE40_04640 [Glaciihabitans arcticus]|uniref:Uncharacterized protein n=1 Tax=Glaciihabitans arcticus TaxID=2668039 RepID=A0A4Q9GRM4_9MICO|nr:hypothetical protein [Glaciihabitans arcticus]TBN56744.1 hypothetical protein EYE40_04640 [Glaciihabitans arcticus]